MSQLSVELITPPSVYPVTLEEAKQHLRVDSTDEDALIQTLIAASTDAVEQFTGRKLVPQVWDVYFPAFTPELELPFPPIIAINEIEYLSSDNTPTILPDSNYSFRGASMNGVIFPVDGTSYPDTYVSWNAVRVQITCGYTPTSPNSPTELASGVPASLKCAILLILGDLYQNREGGALVNGASYEVNPTVSRLMIPYRVDLKI